MALDLGISDTAATHIKHLLDSKNLSGYGLRMGVKGGGLFGINV